LAIKIAITLSGNQLPNQLQLDFQLPITDWHTTLQLKGVADWLSLQARHSSN